MAKMTKLKKREKADLVLGILVGLYPKVFFPKDSSDTQPLMRGIHHLIRMRHRDEISGINLNCFMEVYTSKNRYLQALASKPSRINLAGNPVEDVSKSHRDFAIAQLAEREAKYAAE